MRGEHGSVGFGPILAGGIAPRIGLGGADRVVFRGEGELVAASGEDVRPPRVCGRVGTAGEREKKGAEGADRVLRGV